MPVDNRAPRRRFFFPLLGCVLLLTGCWKKSGDAIVIGKEYVPAREIVATSNESPSPSATAAPVNDETVQDATGGTTEPAVDPRAIDREQWIVNVEMVADRRKIDVCVEAPEWNALKEGDRVQVAYREGKYTGTVWSAKITKRLPSR